MANNLMEATIMTKMNDAQLAEDARKAIERLKELRAQFSHGWITLEEVKAEAPPLIKAYDLYATRKARKFKLSPKKFSLSAFLR